MHVCKANELVILSLTSIEAQFYFQHTNFIDAVALYYNFLKNKVHENIVVLADKGFQDANQWKLKRSFFSRKHSLLIVRII